MGTRSTSSEVGINAPAKKSASKMNIYQRIAAIAAEITSVAKDMVVEAPDGKTYTAVSEKAVLDVVKPLEAKYGVLSIPGERETVESKVITYKDKYGNDHMYFYSKLKIKYRFINIDDPDDFLEMESFGEGLDNQDKAVGKAMTYADKYALMKMYKISGTGEEEERPSLPLNETPITPAELVKENLQKEAEKKAAAKASKEKEASNAETPAAEEPKGETEKPAENAHEAEAKETDPDAITKEEFDRLKKFCADQDEPLKELLRKAGWTDGQKLTRPYYDKAMELLRSSFEEEIA